MDLRRIAAIDDLSKREVSLQTPIVQKFYTDCFMTDSVHQCSGRGYFTNETKSLSPAAPLALGGEHEDKATKCAVTLHPPIDTPTALASCNIKSYHAVLFRCAESLEGLLSNFRRRIDASALPLV
jgi:hypothetical protein